MFVIQCRSPTLLVTPIQTHYTHSLLKNCISYFFVNYTLPKTSYLLIAHKCCNAKNHVKFIIKIYYFYHETSVFSRTINYLIARNRQQSCWYLAAGETSRCASSFFCVLALTLLTLSNFTYKMHVTIHNKNFDMACTFCDTFLGRQIGNKGGVLLYYRTKIFRLRVRTSTHAAAYCLPKSAKWTCRAAGYAEHYYDRFDAPCQIQLQYDDVICAQRKGLYFLFERTYYLNVWALYSRHLSRCIMKKTRSTHTYYIDKINAPVVLYSFNIMLLMEIIIEFKCKNGSD